VASIKPVDLPTPAQVASGKIHAGMKIDAFRVDIGLFSLMDLICKAYDVKQYQVSGPSWMAGATAQRFDIMANLPKGATKEQVPQMLQTLLADRFKLAIHRDNKENSVYALVVGKGGAKLTPSVPVPEEGPAASPPEGGEAGARPAATGSSTVSVETSGKGSATINDGQGGQVKQSMSPDGKSLHIEWSKVSLSKLAEGLSPLMGRPIVDMTEMKGDYQVAMDFSIADLMAAARAAGLNVPGGSGGDAARPAEAAADPTGGGTIAAALQALGLKLESRKTTIDRIVIDHAEKLPTDN